MRFKLAFSWKRANHVVILSYGFAVERLQVQPEVPVLRSYDWIRTVGAFQTSFFMEARQPRRDPLLRSVRVLYCIVLILYVLATFFMFWATNDVLSIKNVWYSLVLKFCGAVWFLGQDFKTFQNIVCCILVIQYQIKT